MKDKAKFLGKLKLWQERVAGYANIISFAMVLYIFILQKPLGFEWYHWVALICLGIISLLSVDVKIIMPNSFNYGFEKTSHLMEMKKDIEDIKKIIMEKK